MDFYDDNIWRIYQVFSDVTTIHPTTIYYGTDGVVHKNFRSCALKLKMVDFLHRNLIFTPLESLHEYIMKRATGDSTYICVHDNLVALIDQ